MVTPLDDEFRIVIEAIKRDSGQKKLIVLLQTNGGYMETVERLVAIMREHYEHVSFVIPNYAFSAGTVLALSGDEIYMDYYSVLGPIDPQFRSKDGFQYPGQGYLEKFNEMRNVINEADTIEEVKAEMMFLTEKFDPAHLYTIEQNIEQGIALITEWLPKYKFKNWYETETRKIPVNEEMRKKRAVEIALNLSNASKWLSHGRGISLRQLCSDDIKLRIENFGNCCEQSQLIRNYHGLALDYFQKIGSSAYIHSIYGFRRTQ